MNEHATPELPPAAPEPGPLRLSLSTAAVMAVFTLVFTGLMAGTYQATHTRIEASAEAEKLRLINEVLPPARYDNALLRDVVRLDAAPELGLPKGASVWRARRAGEPVALVMEAVAPDGYAGSIRLVLAVLHDGSLGGVRVVEHKETPGLGDYIDPLKDKVRDHPWIAQFTGLSPARVALARWAVRKDGGDIAYRAGATISARAVTQAVARAARFAQAERDRLYQ
ncbi:MAG: electron transport complex subunit RsxG [Candidatus Dactylopiibacterium sp.]|nr:electron transport complex subunit RsxG [Candidatus Dactylopiibacterium sp.]